MICDLKLENYVVLRELKENECVLNYCLEIIDTVRKESCGKCVLCREGTNQVYEIISDIVNGNAKSDDYELLLEILSQIKNNSECEMASKAASACMQMMTDYEEEWEAHIKRKRCSRFESESEQQTETNTMRRRRRKE